MSRTPTHPTQDEEPRRRLDDPTPGPEGDDPAEESQEERLELEQERLLAVDGEAEDALGDEEPLEGFELSEDDEDIQELQTDSLLDETPVPDDAHLRDFERQGRVRPTPTGPPNHHRLSTIPEEMGARFLEGITQTDPTDAQEERELFETLPTDKELDIRGGEDEEEPPPEDIPSRWPSSPTGSPGQ